MIVVGLGHRHRGDDGVGPAVVDALEGCVGPDVLLVRHAGDPTSLPELWAGRDVVVVDAVVSGAPPGTVRRLDLLRERVPPGARGTSTHGLGLADAVELSRTLDLLPRSLVLYGVEGADFGRGAAMTPAVAAAVPEVVARVLGDDSAES
ncbi:MAG: hydrogenase maturation protease [Myxococcota bacterium]